MGEGSFTAIGDIARTYGAPLALFVFFLGVLALQARDRGPVRGELGGRTVDEQRAGRVFFATLLVAWSLLMAAILGPASLQALLFPAGLIFVVAGVALRSDYRGARRGIAYGMTAANVWATWGLIVPGVGLLVSGAALALT